MREIPECRYDLVLNCVIVDFRCLLHLTQVLPFNRRMEQGRLHEVLRFPKTGISSIAFESLM